MKLKKAFLTSILGLLCATTMASCGSDSRIKIVVGMWPGTSAASDLAMFEVWKDRFEADYPEYRIEPESYTYSTTTANARGRSGNLPTVFQTWFTEPPMLVNNKYIRDITPQLDALGWDDKMDEEMKKTLTFDNKIYGVPRDGYGLGLFLNLEILEFHGIVEDIDGDGKIDLHDEEGNPLYPTTFDEIREVCEIIHEGSEGMQKGMLILSANKNGGWQFSNMAWNFGATLQVQGADGKWTGALDSAESVAAMEWIRSLAADDLLLNDTVLNYNDWYTKVSSSVAMAIVGSDVVSLAKTNGGMDLDKFAFVPMPAGPLGHRYSLFGGTPFVFASNATDEQVVGALRFLEYMGRSPEISEVSISAITEGHETALRKGMPILPTIRPWINDDFLQKANQLDEKYIADSGVDMSYYQDFYDEIDDMKKTEEPHYPQEMYDLLDGVLQEVLEKPDTVNVQSSLTTANATFNRQYMSKL